jgi:hydroxymethylpyrimidine/phosphomethylpyrimidine kinase
MHKERPFVLSIAGFDPSGGAGILADIKTMETIGAYGLGVCTAITYQNDKNFKGLDWLPLDQIISQIEILLVQYSVEVVKIGLIMDLKMLSEIIKYLNEKNDRVKIIWDPILKASAGFEFHSSIDKEELGSVLNNITLITPNIPEAEKLNIYPHGLGCSCLLKGGHHNENANDVLYSGNSALIIEGERTKNGEKHGSGCVLSSAIAAYMAEGLDIKNACIQAKNYTASFLKSSETLLGLHKPILEHA